ncbi:MAG TPA: MFS transporter [Thermomicrobiales bacterium]|nr:MFS transporter [Thermomicrobiales bacterium]
MASFDAGLYRQVLGQRSFRLFWLGFVFSVLGDSMTRVALTWIVYEQTGSARAIGWLMLCYTGPIVVGGLMAGALLDRFDRRTVMIVDNAIRGVAVATIPLLHLLGRLEIWHIYVVAVVYGLLMMVSLAGTPALIPALVKPEQRSTANALEMLGFTLGGIIGPPLTGLLIGWVAAPYVILLDALTYVGFAIVLAATRTEARVAATRVARRLSSMREVAGLMVRQPVLLSTTLMFMAFNLGSGFIYLTLPVMSDRVLGGGPGLYGALLGVLAAGQVTSALLSGTLTFTRPLGTMICMAQMAAGAALLLLLGQHVAAAFAGLALYGLMSSPLTVWAQTLRMQIIPEQLRGRAFALLRTIMQAGTPIGGAAGGVLLPVLGIPAMIGIGALLVSTPGALGYRVRELRQAGAQAMTRVEPPTAGETPDAVTVGDS